MINVGIIFKFTFFLRHLGSDHASSIILRNLYIIAKDEKRPATEKMRTVMKNVILRAHFTQRKHLQNAADWRWAHSLHLYGYHEKKVPSAQQSTCWAFFGRWAQNIPAIVVGSKREKEHF